MTTFAEIYTTTRAAIEATSGTAPFFMQCISLMKGIDDGARYSQHGLTKLGREYQMTFSDGSTVIITD